MCCAVLSYSVMSDSLQPHGLYVVHQVPLSMGFPRQEYWSGLLFPSPGDILNPGIQFSVSCIAGRFFTTEPPEKSKVSNTAS